MTPLIKARGLNHITLAVSDVDRAIKFYTEGLGLKLRKQSKTAVHLEAGSFWICLSPDPATRNEPHPDYTHIAFDVAEEDFAAMVAQLERVGARKWKDNRSEGDSYYFLDPDGHKLEIHVGNLQSRLAAMKG
jgi:catechol 2,3-dioxygenase-like lactoylglutathione lyase family enzyme